MAMNIVPVNPETERIWAQLCCDLWPVHTVQEFLDERAAGNLPHEHLCFVDDTAVGFMSLSLRTDYVEGTSSSPVGYLEGIYIRPEHRKKGIGKALVAYARAWAKERGCREFASDCEIENEDSRRFHKAIGFAESDVIVHFIMDL